MQDIPKYFFKEIVDGWNKMSKQVIATCAYMKLEDKMGHQNVNCSWRMQMMWQISIKTPFITIPKPSYICPCDLFLPLKYQWIMLWNIKGSNKKFGFVYTGLCLWYCSCIQTEAIEGNKTWDRMTIKSYFERFCLVSFWALYNSPKSIPTLDFYTKFPPCKLN